MRAAELVGLRFGHLEVLARAPRRKGRLDAFWSCRCDCGNHHIVATGDLRRGKILSCGCTRAPNLTGKTFGRLTVVEQAAPPTEKKGDRTFWNCTCSCGGSRTASTTDLRTGRVMSCGCAQLGAVSRLVGRRFGRLLVEEHGPAGSEHKRRYWCRCTCTKRVLVYGASLLSGSTTSCGCLARETVRERNLERGRRSRAAAEPAAA